MIYKYIETPIEDIKSVLVNFHGSFPKTYIPTKDANLFFRLFAYANKFYIRCKCDSETIKYFKSFYAGKTNILGEPIHVHFLTNSFDKWAPAARDTDAMYVHWLIYQTKGRELTKTQMSFYESIHSYTKPIYMFFNELLCHSFKPIQYFTESEQDISKSKHISTNKNYDYSNIIIVPNKTFFGDVSWVHKKLRHFDEQNIKLDIQPICDQLIYDLPTADELIELNKNHNYESRRGVWVGTFFDARVNHINDVFNEPDIIDFQFLGNKCHKLDNYVDHSAPEKVKHANLPSIYKNAAYSIYFGRGKTKLPFMGATFYEPLHNGLPIFVDRCADANEELFSGIECYYSTINELHNLVNSTNLKELYIRQLTHLLA